MLIKAKTLKAKARAVDFGGAEGATAPPIILDGGEDIASPPQKCLVSMTLAPPIIYNKNLPLTKFLRWS